MPVTGSQDVALRYRRPHGSPPPNGSLLPRQKPPRSRREQVIAASRSRAAAPPPRSRRSRCHRWRGQSRATDDRLAGITSLLAAHWTVDPHDGSKHRVKSLANLDAARVRPPVRHLVSRYIRPRKSELGHVVVAAI